MAEPNISKEVWIEDLEKLPDGTYKKKNHIAKAKDGTTFDKHLDNEAAHGIGDKTALKTTHKASIVGAVNELFTNVSNGKSAIATAITGKEIPTSSSDTFSKMAENINSIKVGDYSVGDILTAEKYTITPTKELRILTSSVYRDSARKGDYIYTRSSSTGMPYKRDALGNIPNGYDFGGGSYEVGAFGLDAEGNVYIGGGDGYNSSSPRLSKCSNDGTKLYQRSSSYFSGINYKILSMAVLPSGGLYVYALKLAKLNTEGGEVWVRDDSVYTDGYKTLDVGENGDIYGLTYGRKTIIRVGSNGVKLWESSPAEDVIQRIFFYNGHIYSVGSSYITKFNSDGSISITISFPISSNTFLGVNDDGILFYRSGTKFYKQNLLNGQVTDLNFELAPTTILPSYLAGQNDFYYSTSSGLFNVTPENLTLK